MPPHQPKANLAEINGALLNIKKSIAAGNFRFVEERPKNLATLAQLGFITQNVLDIILELTYKDYLNGPSNDRDFVEDIKTIWEFGHEIEQNPIYIKIKIKKTNDDVVGISFHIAEKPLYYHFRDKN